MFIVCQQQEVSSLESGGSSQKRVTFSTDVKSDGRSRGDVVIDVARLNQVQVQKKGDCFFFFFVIPGAQPLAYTIPHGPFCGGGTLDTSLPPGGGVWGCFGSKLWWGGTGI